MSFCCVCWIYPWHSSNGYILYNKIEIIERTLQTKPAYRIVKYDKIFDCFSFTSSFAIHCKIVELYFDQKSKYLSLFFHFIHRFLFLQEKFYERTTEQRQEKSRENHIANNEIKCNEPETRLRPNTISSYSLFFRGIEQRLSVRWNST